MRIRQQFRLLQSLARPTVAGLAAFAVFALALLSVSPEAHAWIHPGKDHASADHDHPVDHPDHACAVTLAQQGFCDTAPVLPGAAAPAKFVAREVAVPPLVRWTAPEHWLQPAQGPPVTR